VSWFVDDKTRREIEAALGEPLPSPTSQEFRVLMQRLAVENPDLRQRILEVLSASPVELPSERHARRLGRQALLRRLLVGWLERETFAGDVVWDKRRILASAFGAMALLLVAMFVVNRAIWQPPAPRSSGAPVVPQPIPTQSRSRAEARALPSPPSWPRLPVPTPAPRRTPTYEIANGRVPSPVPPLVPRRPPAGLPPYPEGPGSLAWPLGPAATEPSPSAKPADSLVHEVPAGREPSRTLIVYDAQSSAVSGGASAPPQGGMTYQRGPQPPTVIASPPALSVALRAGQMTAARLATALALMQGAGPMPVVAASESPGLTWLGEATLGPDGLVQLTFHTAVGDQAAESVRAIALDVTSRRPGLEAQVRTVARNTASAVVGAALRSTADYVQALVQQRQVTLTNGWATITTGEVPPFWMLLGSRVAELLAPRTQETTRPISVAELPAGAGLTILVLHRDGR
jgi:hypothetical protein